VADTQYPQVKLSEGQLSALTEQIISHREEALNSRADFPLRHSDRYKRFLADPTLRPEGPWPGAPKLFMPTTREILERLHSELWQAQFADLGNLIMKPFRDEDILNAELATRFLRWTLETTISWSQISAALIFDALLDSVAVAKVMVYDAPWKPPSTDASRFLARTVEIDPLDLGMLLVAPDAEGLQYPKARFIAQEFFLSADDLLRMERRGFDVPSYDQLGYSQQMTDRKRVELEREGERIVEFRPDSIPFVESYERFTIDDEDEDVIVSWFPDAQTSGSSVDHGRIAAVRRLTDVFPQDDRPRRPYFDITVWPQPRQWRGLNVPDRLESMQDLENRLHEQLVNYGDVSMLPFIFANTFLTGELPDLRTVRPGSTVPIDDLSGVQFAPTRSLNRHFAEQIQMIRAHTERDSSTSDFNMGRNSSQPNAPRTATMGMALLGESKKSYTMLVKHQSVQFEHLLNFYFRLWQSIIPDNTHVQIFQPNRPSQPEETIFDRLFSESSLDQAGKPKPQAYVALPISADNLSGYFDASLFVNPEAQFDRQVMLQLFQLTAPLIQDYPLGTRTMLKRLWGTFDQKGFDEIYPEEVALLQTKIRMDAAQVQLATFEQQLAQIHQQEAQQQLGALQQQSQQVLQTGQLTPEFLQSIEALKGQQNGAGGGQGGV
jgi:hypothetical protein